MLAYTGDTGPSHDAVDLRRGADLLLAEASYADQVPEDSRRYLSSAAEAGARRLMLTHLMPGTDPSAALAAARQAYDGEISVATAGLALDIA